MSDKIAKSYGYAVCLITVITFLISVSSLVSAFFDLSDPLHAKSHLVRDKSLASYEVYKMDILKSLRLGGDEGESVYIPDDEAIRGMFEASKEEMISTVTLGARRYITVNGILVLLSIAIFAFHWIWMRRLAMKLS